jgi:hypothetical protein
VGLGRMKTLRTERSLVTSVQKPFNGQTKFLLNNVSIAVNTLVMDDAHACADRIREHVTSGFRAMDPA